MKNLICGVVLAFLLCPAVEAGWNGGGGGGSASHATDCPNSGMVAAPGTVCVDQDDGKVWTCKATPSAGASPTSCDIAADWLLGSSSSASGVSTFNARAGVVVPAANDYNATQVTSSATGAVAATTVQAAITELDTEKQPLDADLTTLAGKALYGTDNAIPTIASGSASGLCVQTKSGGGLEVAAAACGTGSGGGLTDGDYGDVTVSGSGAAIAVNANAITNTKLTDMAENTLKGRVTTGTGDPEDVTVAQVAALLPVFTTTGVQGVVPGSVGGTSTFLRADGNWASPPTALQNTSSALPPTATDDADLGYSIFSRHFDTATGIVWVATDVTPDSADWIQDSYTTPATPGLQAVSNVDRSIFNANSEANAVKIGIDDGDGNCNEAGESCRAFYSDAGTGSIMKVIPDGHLYYDAASGFAHIFRVAGTDIMRFNASTLVFNTKQTIPFYWDAGAVSTDGTGCAEPSEETVNSGPKLWNFGLADNCSIWGKVRMRSAWEATEALTFTLSVRAIGASSTAFNGDFSAMCRTPNTSDTIDATWGTAVECAGTTGTTAHAVRECTAANVTPNGTCAAGDWLYWRFVADNANNAVTASTAKVIGGMIGAKYAQLGD